jgi:glycosyltransferase involved in cell wall biosynthesis
VRILLINYEYPPVGAGSATAARAIARSLVEAGHSATVLTTRFGELAGVRDEDGVRVIRVASRRGRREAASVWEMASFVLKAGTAVRDVVRAGRIDGMIAFFSMPGGPVAWWAHLAGGVPYVVSLRGGDVPGAESGLRLVHSALAPFRRCILRSARAIVANSEGLKAMAEKADPFPVRVISNGVDTAFYKPSASPRSAAKPARLLFVGRFQSQKNLPWLLDQLADVRGPATRPFELDLVGDGPLRGKIEEHTRALHLSDVVRFHGWLAREDLRGLYQSADLILNPSLYEGMPNVVLEAMACGCPALASRVAGNDAVVNDGVTGWLFEPGDAQGFRERLRELLARPEEAIPLGIAARERAQREFSWQRTTQSYLELLAAPSPTPPKA